MKKCSMCGVEKDANEFYKDSRVKSGLYSRCKVCFHKATQEYQKSWVAKNRKACSTKLSKYCINRRKSNEKFRIDCLMSISLSLAVKGKISEKLMVERFGYTISEFKNHFEGLFDENMSWDNYGKYWWIDHIRPKAVFEYSEIGEDEFNQCWSLSNLQPLEKIKNIVKRKTFSGL